MLMESGALAISKSGENLVKSEKLSKEGDEPSFDIAVMEKLEKA